MTRTELMKWWGWGQEGVEFTHDDKPDLAPFIEQQIGLRVAGVTEAPIRFEALEIPESGMGEELRRALEAEVGPEYVSIDPHDRVVHSRGKSIRDLILHRRGELGRLPDVVVRPGSEEEVAAVLRLVIGADAVLIPFGGGSSISGSLQSEADEKRTVVSLDLARLDQVLEVDSTSRLARVQAGVFGPDLERQLERRGYTLGHFPDSFPHSTLGGWIATRSSGMQSDRYGDIADITKGLRVVTPVGTLVVKPIPAMSTGPSIRQMVIGSEGRLGVVTEATVQVHPIPPRRQILGYLFPTFGAGVEAIREITESEASVSVTRVSDAPETQFSFVTRVNPTILDRAQSWALKLFLKWRLHYDTEQMALSFIGFEGSERHVKAQRRAVGEIVKRHRGICIGAGPGALYDQKKFDTPFIRDFLLDRGVVADVSETAMPWSRLMAVYEAVNTAANDALAKLGVRGYVMCHLSHSYHSGACLYFTFALTPTGTVDPLVEYDVLKSAIQQAFIDNGGTLSHHHAVGTEHARWLEQDISAPAVGMLRALFEEVDPGHQLNPGKIV